MTVFLFGLLGMGLLGMGALVISRAPDFPREVAGILLVLCGIVSLGFGAVLSALKQRQKQADE